jgi:hypothetical protein
MGPEAKECEDFIWRTLQQHGPTPDGEKFLTEEHEFERCVMANAVWRLDVHRTQAATIFVDAFDRFAGAPLASFSEHWDELLAMMAELGPDAKSAGPALEKLRQEQGPKWPAKNLLDKAIESVSR